MFFKWMPPVLSTLSFIIVVCCENIVFVCHCRTKHKQKSETNIYTQTLGLGSGFATCLRPCCARVFVRDNLETGVRNGLNGERRLVRSFLGTFHWILADTSKVRGDWLFLTHNFPTMGLNKSRWKPSTATGAGRMGYVVTSLVLAFQQPIRSYFCVCLVFIVLFFTTFCINLLLFFILFDRETPITNNNALVLLPIDTGVRQLKVVCFRFVHQSHQGSKP